MAISWSTSTARTTVLDGYERAITENKKRLKPRQAAVIQLGTFLTYRISIIGRSRVTR